MKMGEGLEPSKRTPPISQWQNGHENVKIPSSSGEKCCSVRGTASTYAWGETIVSYPGPLLCGKNRKRNQEEWEDSPNVGGERLIKGRLVRGGNGEERNNVIAGKHI